MQGGHHRRPGLGLSLPKGLPYFLSPSPVLKAQVSKHPVASVIMDGLSHLFLHHEKIPDRIYD